MKNQAGVGILNGFLVKNKKIVAWRVIEEEAVIVNLKKGTFNILNPVATRIWELADGQTSVREVMERIAQEFKVERDRLERDCLEFANQMVDKDLLIFSFTREGGD